MRRLALLALALPACGGSTPASNAGPAADAAVPDVASPAEDAQPPPADAGPDAQVYPAPHPPPPRVITFGGPVLKTPKIVPITYDGDPMRANIEGFAAALGSTAYWKTVAAEYGVGPASTGRPVHLGETAPMRIDDTAVRTWLAAKLDGTHPEWDLPDDDTMYALYYPAGTVYTSGPYTGCKEFGASDTEMQLANGQRVPYIVLPRCPNWPGLDAWGSISMVSSHEFFEEATDPFKTAYVTNDADHMAWSLMPPFSEIGDMCMAAAPLFVRPPELLAAGDAVQRAWSNAAAAAGHDPCVPSRAGAVYFNAAPVLEDSVPISFAAWSGMTKGVKIPVGQTRSIEVDLFSEAPMPAWRVRAFDLAEVLGQPAELQLSLDRAMGQNGDKLTLTITPLKAGAGGGSRFILFCDSGSDANFWFGYVGN